MRAVRVWRSVLGVQHTVIEKVELESVGGEEVLVATVRPTRSRQGRCGCCDRRAPRYDNGEGPRRWRGLDAGTTRVYLQAEAPRVSCPVHGVIVAAVPWARHDSRFSSAFEDTAAWLACHAAFSVLAALLRITWRSVAAVITRVIAARAAQSDRLTGLRRIGVDEISYRKGHRYLLCVVDHDTGRLVWAAKGRDSATLRRFFDALGEDRSALLTHISADGAEWIHTVATERAPQAVLCLDAFHVVAWATAALDAVRRGTWNQLRRDGKTDQATTLKNSRWALLKNPPDLTGDQRTTVATIAKTNHPLYRAYLLKEQLREVFTAKGTPGKQLLAGWLSWASRSRLPEFVALAKTIKRYLPLIHNTLEHGVSNALSEATNTHLRLLTRRAYGYHSAEALIAMATLTRGGLCPPLPGRS
ncbi:MAG: ISL3 family transposase [Pseudonocardia sp.]|nr:ISL3 family transposase [Pseudonocardia sp.]